ncbi:MAG: substrate-binding domain-containing protein [Actinomycetes bacterium]
MALKGSAGLDRRGFLLGAGALGTGVVLAGCTSNDPEASGDTEQASVSQAGGGNAKPGKPVTIGFSAPAADHGWIAAITKNAQAQAKQYEEVTLRVTEGTNDVNQQISQVQTLIDRNVDVLVILPFDGKALTEVAREAMQKGIPVVNLDRIFSSPLAYRTWIGGDNYGMGVNAGNYIAAKLEETGKQNPVIVEVAGIDNLELTQQRSQGFKESLASAGFSVTARQAAEFTVESGQQVMSTLLQAEPEIDAVWNHDDDQGVGVLAAIDQEGRDEFFMVGGAGSSRAMQQIKAGDGVLEATVLYSPSMSSSAISLARLIGQNRGMSDLVEHEVPASLTTYSAVVTRDNVDDYMAVGFA